MKKPNTNPRPRKTPPNLEEILVNMENRINSNTLDMMTKMEERINSNMIDMENRINSKIDLKIDNLRDEMNNRFDKLELRVATLESFHQADFAKISNSNLDSNLN